MPVISALWSESVLSEVLVFLLIGPRLVRLLAPGGAIALAAVAGIIRWTVAAFTTSPVILAFVQPLHGFTFALLHLAAMQVIVQVVPLRLAATAQAIYGTLCIGLATALLTLASGLSLWSDGRTRVSRHGRALSAGAAIMRSIALTGYSGVIPAARSDDSFGWIADPSVAAEHSLDGWTSLRGFNHDHDHDHDHDHAATTTTTFGGVLPVARGRNRHIRTWDKHASPLI